MIKIKVWIFKKLFENWDFNIKNLEELSNNIIQLINELKEIYEKINKSKEELKLKIMKIFNNKRSIK